MATLEGLRRRYEPQGRFHQFYYFNEAASQACADFGINLNTLQMIDDQDVPTTRATLLDRFA
jgi:hypothetical protein